MLIIIPVFNSEKILPALIDKSKKFAENISKK